MQLRLDLWWLGRNGGAVQPPGAILDVCAQATDSMECVVALTGTITDTCAEVTDSATGVVENTGTINDACAEAVDSVESTVVTDGTAPTLSSITIAANGLTAAFLYNEALNTGSVPATGAFAFSGTASTASSVGVSGSTVTVTFNTAVGAGQVVLASYTAGGSPIEDLAGNNAANLTNNATTNNSTVDITAPVLSSAVVNTTGTTLTLTYNETLAATTPAAGAFSLSTTILNAAVTAVGAPSGATIALTVAPPILRGEAPTLNYTAGGSPIEDVAGNNAANLVAQALTNNSTVDLDLVVITRFSGTTGNFPTVVGPPAVAECWGAGGGATQGVSAGGSGAYAREDAYVYTSNEAWNLTTGTGGASGGGTGGDTTFQSTVCVAKGAVGNVGGLVASCVGDVKRAGASGEVSAGTNSGGGSPGSNGAAGTAPVPGGPDGGPGGISTTGANSQRQPGGGGAGAASAHRAGADGMARLMYQVASLMTHPDLLGFALTRVEANGTNHTLNMPSRVNGDRLTYHIASDGNPTFTLTGATLTAESASGSAVHGAQYSYVVDGSEPTTLTTSASETVSVIVLRWRNVTTISATATNATGANADPPSHDMGSSAATTWVVTGAFDSTATGGNVSARPTDYNESFYLPPFAQTGGTILCVAWRDATLQIENPGAFASTGDNVTITSGLRR